MKLITYEKDSKSFIGSIDEGGIVAFENDPSIPKDMLGFLDEGLSSMEKAKSLHADKKNRIVFFQMLILKLLFLVHQK